MILEPSVSMLMSVYSGDKGAFVQEALDSMKNQTYKISEFVIVQDGTVSTDVLNVLNNFMLENTNAKLIQLDDNKGLANALNEGLKYVSNELVVRVDSDDISVPDRVHKEVQMFSKNPKLSVVSGNIREFSATLEQLQDSRVLPEHHEDLVRFAQWRSPANHPAVMFKKSAVEDLHGYANFYRLEDYHLWVRMMMHGRLFANIPAVLVYMRTGEGMYKRRGGIKYLLSYFKLRREFKSWGFSSLMQETIADILMVFNVLLPSESRSFIYKKLLRK